MADRYEAKATRKYTTRDGEEKTQWINLGMAFPFREKDGFTLRLNSIPAPVDGEWTILLMPPRPKEDAPAGNPSSPPPSTPADMDDEIPF